MGATFLSACSATSPAPDQNREEAGPPGPTLSIEALGEALARKQTRHWAGFVVEPPPVQARPDLPRVVRSGRAPVAVHWSDDLSTPASAGEALKQLEWSYTTLKAWGWPPPPPDGQEGGDPGFDLYLVPPFSRRARSESDGRVPWSFDDQLVTFGLVGAPLGSAPYDACVSRAYAEAVLSAMDPAEDTRWTFATAEWLATALVGRPCESDGSDRFSGLWTLPTNAPLIEMLDRTLAVLPETPSDSPVLGLWTLARQRTWDGELLRASPDFFEVLRFWADKSRQSLDDLFSNLATLRCRQSVFGDDGTRTFGAVEVTRITSERLPYHGAPALPALEPYGAHCYLITVPTADTPQNLKLWLEGEAGARWSLVAARLGADGEELGRMVAPPKDRDPTGFLPVTLFEGTKFLLAVVTRLPMDIPKLHAPSGQLRSFRLTASAE